MPSRAVSTRSRTSCKGRFIPGAQEGWRPCCSRTTAPETGPSPFLAVLSNGEGRCRGEARCTWKTLPGSGRGTRKTASGGAAWGAGPSCGSYAHCGFDAHDLRRGQQTRRPIKVSDNRASPARQKPFTATTKSPHEDPAPHAASQVCWGAHPGKTFLFPNYPHLRPCVMTQWNLCKSLRVLWGKDRDEPEGAQGGSWVFAPARTPFAFRRDCAV